MLAKWKNILTNWINCYSNTPAEKQQSVSAESLLAIIEHLRDNFSLDESISSILEAHTLEEFLAEKYPDFKLGELEQEDEVYIVASLLLYFVCVTSKDVNIKNAMCNKLSLEDQEIIMKFSKSLMGSNAITLKVVESAVLEACGQDTASAPERRPLIAETPPALRSLHGEVRRLQAALDAERFDRNYLQEELTRSNMRIDKLAKEKEECKSDILNLRAKISLCCGQDRQERPEGGGDSSTAKLLRQLDELEQRLGDTRAQLDDAIYERDAYKAKVDTLKQERNKWLSLSQEEGNRAIRLSEQLDAERQNAEGLRELVAELRMHRQHALDASQLECDDPDATGHSFAHNASVCSEACANVIEIQLGEERARAAQLQLQMQALQEQIEEVNRKAEEESLSLHKILTDKDGDILELKHRVNEEIEEKNTLKSYYSEQCMRLNNEINELEQRIKDNNTNSTRALENKMEEIKTLQEEKLILLQSLNDETTKLEEVIKNQDATIQRMQSDLYTERNSKQTMKEDYENHMMKLKEKVLNRNNECVELQNNVCEKSEKIETLQCEIRQLKEEREKSNNKSKQQISQLNKQKASLDRNLTQKSKDIQELNSQIQEKVQAFEQLSREFSDLKNILNNTSDQIKCLEEVKQELTEEVRLRDEGLVDVRNELEKVKNHSAEQEKSYREMFEERSNTIAALQAHLEAEITARNTLQNEIGQLYTARAEIADELSRLTTECEKLTHMVQEKERMIDGMDLYLNEEKEVNNKLKMEYHVLKDSADKMTKQLGDNDEEIRALRNVLDNELKSHNEDNLQKDEMIAQLYKSKDELSNLNLALEEAKKQLILEVEEKWSEVAITLKKCNELTSSIQELDSELKTLQKSFQDQQTIHAELQAKYDSETTKLTTRVKETERILKELRLKSNKTIEEKDAEVLTLRSSIELIETALQNEKQAKENLNKQLQDVIEQNNVVFTECSNLKIALEEITSEVTAKRQELETLQEQNQTLKLKIEEYHNDNSELKQKLEQEVNKTSDLEQKEEVSKHLLQSAAGYMDTLIKNMQNHSDNPDFIEPTVPNKQQNDLYQLNEDQFKKVFCVWKQYKEHTNDIIAFKDKMLEEYEEQVTVAKNNLNAKISELNSEHEIVLKQSLAVETDKYENLDHERLMLVEQLAEEKAFVEDLQAENQALSTKMDELNEMMKKEQELNKAVCEDRDELLTKLDVLNDQITKTQEEIATATKLNDTLVQEKEILVQHYKEVEGSLQVENEKLLHVKEMLTQQLLEEKSTKEVENQTAIIEKEKLVKELAKEKSVKDMIESEKLSLIEEKDALENQLQHVIEAKTNLEKSIKELEQDTATLKDVYESEKEKLITELNNSNQNLLDERATNQTLVSDNDKLIQKVLEEEAKVNALSQEKQIILLEKEGLVKEVSEEKSVRDQIENEKSMKVGKLEQECKNKSTELSATARNLQQITDQLQTLQEDLNAKQDQSNKMSSTINLGLTRVISSLKKEEIQNELLQKLISNQPESLTEQCDLLLNITEVLQSEVCLRKNLEKALEHETSAMDEVRRVAQLRDVQLHELQAEYRTLQASLAASQAEQARKSDAYAASLQEQLRQTQRLQADNQALRAELGGVKVQLEQKVLSLKEKLVDNENLTEKLKMTYECQIENLNVVSNKLTDYLKDKARELDALRREADGLRRRAEESAQVIKSQEEEIKSLKQGQEKLISDFESERLVLKNMVSVTESVMEDQKTGLDKVIAEHEKAKVILESENRKLKEQFESEKLKLETVITEKEVAFDTLFKDLTEERKVKEIIIKESEIKIQEFEVIVEGKIALENDIKARIDSTEKEITTLNEKYTELQTRKDYLEELLGNKEAELQQVVSEKNQIAAEKETIEKLISEKEHEIAGLETKIVDIEIKVTALHEQVANLTKAKEVLESEVNGLESAKNALESENKVLQSEKDALETEKLESTHKLAEVIKLQKENADLVNIVEEKKTVISKLEHQIKSEAEQSQQLKNSNIVQHSLESKCAILEQYQSKAEKHLEDRERETNDLQATVRGLKAQVEGLEMQLNEKNTIISKVSKELFEEKAARDKLLKQHEGVKEREEIVALRKENVELKAAQSGGQTSAEHGGWRRGGSARAQVDMSTSDLAPSPNSSAGLALDALRADTLYLKNLVADSENRLLDVSKELELTKEANQQLKKIVQQKNEELTDLKKQVSKMSVTENRASQIIKVSAKYQAIILKRIAEIKSNTVLKELQNFGNKSEDSRKSIAGSVTIEDLENFLETTDRHLKRYSEKQVTLQKERDRLTEVNRINESEIISMKKFLTELSVSFKTFNSVKELYTQKLSRVVAVQRTLRREILNLEGNASDTAMCKLERGYAAMMQDLAETVLNLERWASRVVARSLAPERLHQAYLGEERPQASCQNSGLEAQLDDLEKSFQKLLEEVLRAHKTDRVRDAQASTVQEVRAEYEDKLNRMKAKMKQLYQEQISIFREKQKDEIAALEKELQKAQEKLVESSRGYEEHIRGLTTELWNVGEKFLVKQDEAEWLRRRRQPSLLSLQHLPNPTHDDRRQSDASSLRSLPVHNTHKPAGRKNAGLHMSDEEGEVFDNRWLQDLTVTPRSHRSPPPPARRSPPAQRRSPPARLSELRWRNSLCPPHLKSSYPAETQFAAAINEEDIKCVSATLPAAGRPSLLRKEVGITAYKKPGPPTPSKQAGRLSATDSELRESLRPDGEPAAAALQRKTTTPSRIRSLFFSSKNDTNDGTPRRRLSIFRNKK